MCEPSDAVINLFRFAEIEAGLEQSDICREPIVGVNAVSDAIIDEYSCDCDRTVATDVFITRTSSGSYKDMKIF